MWKDPEGRFVCGIPCLIFLLRSVGLGMVRSVCVDRGLGIVSAWRGWLVPMWGGDHRLDDFATVQIALEGRWEGRAVVAVYAIYLLGFGERKVCVGVFRRYLKGRARAEEIAGFLGFDMLDATAKGDPVRIRAHHVGKSLRQQILEARQARPSFFSERNSTDVQKLQPGVGPLADVLILPPPPKRLRTKYETDGARLILEIPPPPWWRLLLLPFNGFAIVGGIAAVIAFGVVACFVEQPFDWESHSRPALLWTLGFGGFGAVIGFCGALPGAFTGYRVVAHPGGLTVRWQGLIFGRTHEMQVDSLKELRLTPDGLEAFGRDAVIEIGHRHLRRGELPWLRESLTRAIAG
jgi:hypothetical protein